MGAEMNEREALKLALEALDCICSPLHVREITKVGNAMKAIKETLSQPEQESDDLTIAYMTGFHDGKNKDASQPKPEQEPVAWRSWNDKDKFGFWDTKSEAESWCDLDFDSEPLYTAPPQRTWVGLDDEDMKELRDANFDLLYGARWAERKLREKNGG